MNLELQSMAIALPPIAAHPNRAPFRGVLTLVDTPSDHAPAGAKGHRVLLTRAAAEVALPSLLGMALDYTPALDRHDARRKVGIITEAQVVNGYGSRRSTQTNADNKENQRSSAFISGGFSAPRLEISGYLYARDFPEVMRELRRPHTLGMSYEISDARISDMNAPVWTISACTFTGAAILRRDKAAYRDTWIELIG